MPPFGSDRFGHSMFIKVIDGAKYTIGIALIVAIIRMGVGVVLGMFLIMLGKYRMSS
jgi:peptide/nickel transport system permease protein